MDTSKNIEKELLQIDKKLAFYQNTVRNIDRDINEARLMIASLVNKAPKLEQRKLHKEQEYERMKRKILKIK